MPKDSSRLPTSSSDFGLPSSSVASTSSVTLEDASFILHRFRRPSLLAPKATYQSETRLHSPLVASFTLQPPPIKRRVYSDDDCMVDSQSYRDRMGRESSPSSSSENPTPPLAHENGEDLEDGGRTARPKSLQTPPRKTSSLDSLTIPRRRLSFPMKQPRISNLLAESRPVENEVKSEAAFQRLVASGAELPIPPRTPHTVSDRGRYPEEAREDDFQREDSPSDDEAEDEPYASFSSSEPIAISNNRTPAGSVNGDDLNTMSISESPSFNGSSMDVDMPSASPSVSSLSSTPINHWRYTPPPTNSAVRSNKRKLEDRFDPYPAASKRRAVSPSVSLLRDSHPSVGSPKSRATPRLPIAIPVAVPGSNVNSAASSPTIGGSFLTSFSRPVPMTSSPTLRASMGLASPILRPLARGIRRDGEEKEVEGAGEAVGGLSLG